MELAVPAPVRGGGAAAVGPAFLVVAGGVEQCLDRHHDLYLDGDVTGGGLTGESFDESVGEDL